MQSIVDYEIVPLIQEYWFDDRNNETLKSWKEFKIRELGSGGDQSSPQTGNSGGVES